MPLGGIGDVFSSSNTTRSENRESIFNNTGSGAANNFGELNLERARNSNVTLNLSDYGAVESALDFASSANAANADSLSSIAQLASSALSDASSVAQPVNVNTIIKYAAITTAVIFGLKYGVKFFK